MGHGLVGGSGEWFFVCSRSKRCVSLIVSLFEWGYSCEGLWNWINTQRVCRITTQISILWQAFCIPHFDDHRLLTESNGGQIQLCKLNGGIFLVYTLFPPPPVPVPRPDISMRCPGSIELWLAIQTVLGISSISPPPGGPFLFSLIRVSGPGALMDVTKGILSIPQGDGNGPGTSPTLSHHDKEWERAYR